jgi:heterodisulfide reductase subunit A
LRSRVHTIDPVPDSDDLVRYVTEDGETITETFDMIVLSIGLQTDPGSGGHGQKLGIELTDGNFCKTDTFIPWKPPERASMSAAPSRGPRTFPSRWWMPAPPHRPPARFLPRRATPDQGPKSSRNQRHRRTARIGVFVCRCGINIAGVVDVPAVRDYAGNLPYVEYVGQPLLLLPGYPGHHDPDHQTEKTEPGRGGRLHAQNP